MHAATAFIASLSTAFLFLCSPVVADDTLPDILRLDYGSQEFLNLAQAERERPGSPGDVRRQRPGRVPLDKQQGPSAATTLDEALEQRELYEDSEVPPVSTELFPVKDRWSMLYKGKWYDPYNQNILKGDIPVFGSPGHEWFLNVEALSDSMYEFRELPTPVGIQTTVSPDSNNVFGDFKQNVFIQNMLFEVSLIRGNTTFKPQDYELRIAPGVNINAVDFDEQGLLRSDPSRGSHRVDSHIGFQELFLDKHLVDLNDRYDFISSRVGIQSFNADFRGFVFISEEPGARLFGTLDENRYQWNLAWFNRLEKDANSGLNTVFEDRREQVMVANVYRQDLIAHGHNVQAVVLHRQDRPGEGQEYDENDFLVRPASIGDERPKNIYSTYVGLNSDGHFGRVNVNSSFYHVFGSESHNPIATAPTTISAFMGALELSYDIDWVRPRTSFFYSSGDDDPFDSQAGGFDSVVDKPNFSGGDLSYWQRQGIPLVAGGGVFLVNRNSLIPDLKPGKEHGQSNFVNPGLLMYTVGLDFDVTPKLELLNNVSYLRFDDSSTLEVLRGDGNIDESIGFDISTGLVYRPFLNNNIQFRLGAAALIPDDGLKNLYGSKTLYQGFTNMIFLY